MAAPKKNNEPIVAKTFSRGSKEFRHDLYRSDTQKMQRNVSFQKGIVTLVSIDHAHIFHSHNSVGAPQKFCSAVGGHFHEVSHSVDAEGNLVTKCGPALRTAFKKKASGTKKITEPVRWKNGDADDETDAFIVDQHRHSFTYEGSETLSSNKISAIQAQTQAAVAKGMPAQRMEPATTENKDDGATIMDTEGDV